MNDHRQACISFKQHRARSVPPRSANGDRDIVRSEEAGIVQQPLATKTVSRMDELSRAVVGIEIARQLTALSLHGFDYVAGQRAGATAHHDERFQFSPVLT